MSEHLHRHYFPPLCILTDCWCIRLQTAVVLIGAVTSSLAASAFVYYLYHLLYGIYGTSTHIDEYYLEQRFNMSMYKVYKRFNRTADSICVINYKLTPLDSDSRRSMQWNRPRAFSKGKGAKPVHFDLDDIPADFLKIFSDDDVARLAVGRFNYDSPAGYFHAREFWREYRKWKARRQNKTEILLAPDKWENKIDKILQKRKTPTVKPGLPKTFVRMYGTAQSICSTPYLFPRLRVDHKMNDLRVKLFGRLLDRAEIVNRMLCVTGLVAAIAAMVMGVLLVCGVVHSLPMLVLPWLLVAGYFAIFNLFFVNMRIATTKKSTKAWNAATVPLLIVITGLVLIVALLAIFVVASYFYLIYTTGMYLHHFPRTAQLVVSGATQPKVEDEGEEEEAEGGDRAKRKSGALSRPSRV